MCWNLNPAVFKVYVAVIAKKSRHGCTRGGLGDCSLQYLLIFCVVLVDACFTFWLFSVSCWFSALLFCATSGNLLLQFALEILNVFCFRYVFSIAVPEKYSDDAFSNDGSAVGLHSVPDFPNEFHVTSVQLLRVPSHSKCVAIWVVCSWPWSTDTYHEELLLVRDSAVMLGLTIVSTEAGLL